MTRDTPDPEPDPRERIRDAALEQFGTYGFRGASVRGIAAAAGVSPGLVQHHFSTKEQLREECDAYVLSAIQGLRISVSRGDGVPGDGTFVAESARQLAQITQYLTRALLDGDTEVASHWFEATAAEYRTVFTDERFAPPFPPDTDLDAVVAAYTAMQLGLGIFMGEIGRHLNVDVRDPETLVRVAKARLFVAGQRMVTDEARARLEDGFDTYLDQLRNPTEPASADSDSTPEAPPPPP